MKNYYSTLQAKGSFAFAILVFMLCTNSLQAQSVSYNANTIPIFGNQNTAFGFDALKGSIGDGNSATGFRSLFSNKDGSFNTANGCLALYSNTTGTNNTASGYRALFSNTTGNDNTANGYQALYLNITGNRNTANGRLALYSNTTGNDNTANGNQALYGNMTGSSNTANGTYALFYNSNGNRNTANGYEALLNNTTGVGNTGTGNRALYASKTGNYNIAFGDSAGLTSVGSRNIFLGRKAGLNETGNDKLYIGNDANKTILYGDMSTGQLLLGNNQPTGYTFKGSRTLNVLGGILADSVRVALSGEWSDFVFSDNYALRPLEELEKFIQTHKHLPNIPSAAAVEANGIDVAEMDARLLEKIEELTLYILQQQKQLADQQNLLLEQQKQIDKLLQLVNEQ